MKIITSGLIYERELLHSRTDGNKSFFEFRGTSVFYSFNRGAL